MNSGTKSVTSEHKFWPNRFRNLVESLEVQRGVELRRFSKAPAKTVIAIWVEKFRTMGTIFKESLSGQVSFKTEVPWAPHSPDLSPLDFMLWGY